jgi:hypothetical protein
MRMPRRGLALAATVALGAAAVFPGGASGEASDDASCAGQFATSVPGGPIKGDFASENASEDGRRFGEITSTLFARGDRDACPF